MRTHTGSGLCAGILLLILTGSAAWGSGGTAPRVDTPSGQNPSGKDSTMGAMTIPRWAELAREVLGRQHEVILRRIRKQPPEGSAGGGRSYGGGAEIFRDWPAVALATGDERIRESMRKIADGIHAPSAPDGFGTDIRKARPSAEPSVDTAVLTFIDYGNPVHVERCLGFMKLHRGRDTREAGPGFWAAWYSGLPSTPGPIAEAAGSGRTRSGGTSHDRTTGNSESPYGRFLISGDTAVLEKALRETLDHLRRDLPRVKGGAAAAGRIPPLGASLIQGMYLGRTSASGPPGAITWKDTGSDFAALVRENSPKGLRLSVVGFSGREREIGIRFWDLERGEYAFRYGPDADDDGRIDGAGQCIPFTVGKRGDVVRFTLPLGKPLAVEITQTRPLPAATAPLPDIAFTRADIVFARSLPEAGHGTAASVLIHNIGGAFTGPFTITLAEEKGGKRRIIDTAIFPGLDAPADFTAKAEAVALAGFITPDAERLVITADPENRVDEVFEGNNETVIGLQ